MNHPNLDLTVTMQLSVRQVLALAAVLELVDTETMLDEGVDPELDEPAQEVFDEACDILDAFLGEDWPEMTQPDPTASLVNFLEARL